MKPNHTQEAVDFVKNGSIENATYHREVDNYKKLYVTFEMKTDEEGRYIPNERGAGDVK